MNLTIIVRPTRTHRPLLFTSLASTPNNNSSRLARPRRHTIGNYKAKQKRRPHQQ